MASMVPLSSFDDAGRAAQGSQPSQPSQLLLDRLLPTIPGNPQVGLRQVDALWSSLRQGTRSASAMVTKCSETGTPPDWDVVICGATLGVIVGAILAQRGWRVALIERGVLRGRQQEWNISRRELAILEHLGLLSLEELTAAIASEYNPARVAFQGGPEIWVRDVLNVGVDPIYLLDCCKAKFLAAGGQLLERQSVQQVMVERAGVQIRTNETTLHSRLLLDMMGHFSPIAQQARQNRKPDGICLVVGSCAQGYSRNQTGDLMVSFQPLRNQCQYFWEAFPARDGRTTYLFTYLDAHPDRLSLTQLLEDYFQLLPEYQQVDLDQLQFQRLLFGVLPCHRNSPLSPAWDRILQVGDSSGTQSPLSFGGFGALLRHLDRLTQGIEAALKADCLSQSDLALLNPYQPNLSVTWLFQRAMSVGVNQTVAPNQINDLLSRVFTVMEAAGDDVLKPFLQDVVQFGPLAQTMIKTGLTAPGAIAKVIPQVGIPALLDWTRHYAGLAAYSGLYALLTAVAQEGRSGLFKPQTPEQHYRWSCFWQALRYGSGQDYH